MEITKKDGSIINENKIIDTIRGLGIDMIHEANSGHPGIVLGAAPIIYALYAHHLNIDSEYPEFINRDRFVMSCGHGSALLYATLFLAGYDISIEDLKKFRQIDSITPGHPEYGVTPGVDVSTGPLGQGIANAVGMAIGEAYLNKYFDNKIINHYTYCLVSDGDLEEGISYEACSLAGTLKLNKLIVLYDSNNISLDGETKLSFNENVGMRFISQGWNVITVNDGSSYELISKAIEEAKASVDKPTLIEIKTILGSGSINENTNKVHGSPLSDEDISQLKEKYGIRNIPFAVTQNSIDDFRYIIKERCGKRVSKFFKALDSLEEDKLKDIELLMNKENLIDIKDLMYDTPSEGVESPRDTSSKLLNSIVSNNPFMMGGSADLFSSNKTYIKDGGDFSYENRLGRNIYFGIREHAMGAIINGLALSGIRAYASTFLSFADYMRGSIRMACMMDLPNTYIFTHDSISVGEDGPTHQPVEQLTSLRSMPNMDVFRPCDVNEVIGSYKAIFEKEHGPSTIALSRNKLPILENTSVAGVAKGGYIVIDSLKKPQAIVISCGEELHQVIEASRNLRSKGIELRVVSMPNLDLFLRQDKEYIDEVIPVEVRKIVVEAGSSYSWNKLIFNPKYLITLDTFGTSGKYQDVYKKYGFDSTSLEEKIEELLK